MRKERVEEGREEGDVNSFGRDSAATSTIAYTLLSPLLVSLLLHVTFKDSIRIGGVWVEFVESSNEAIMIHRYQLF
ncbi:uncharacterized protein BDR25DRAFT_355890 [Lindgomyces ingoldianus]|uniref:Uncharacterized protein n=1 Tax=Lindgomyces ingoldianus TaxID=673940 RepID=A0ACB6QTI8_9PLEO|nr:uncharacterized protein BDR25DRAFT_355890 [Lindgomyces ingoldianus]KAF2470186.1 hypothetical protein BDR25DRAFT_355890 [Lindgomyces ingoldianus]